MLLWLAVTAAVGLVLRLADADMSAVQVTGGVLTALAGLSVIRAVDDPRDPTIDVPLWRVGYRQRRWPQLLASIDADNRR